MLIRGSFAVWALLASAKLLSVDADPTVEEMCMSNDIACIAAFEDEAPGRFLQEPRTFKNHRMLTPASCNGISAALVCEGICNPWGQQTRIFGEMSAVFPTWTHISIAGTSPSQVDLSSYDVIVVEGGDRLWSTTAAWLSSTGNLALQNLATQGKNVLINAAPNNGPASQILPYSFTGIQNIFATSVNIVDTDLTDGPFLPTVTAATGSAYSHGSISPGTVSSTALITDQFSSHSVLVELDTASTVGKILLGRMTTTNFHFPAIPTENIRKNILEYLCFIDTDGDGVPDDEDNCPEDFNPGQEDADNDNVGDVCDNCINTYNPDQQDLDGDDIGDVCDLCCIDGYEGTNGFVPDGVTPGVGYQAANGCTGFVACYPPPDALDDLGFQPCQPGLLWDGWDCNYPGNVDCNDWCFQDPDWTPMPPMGCCAPDVTGIQIIDGCGGYANCNAGTQAGVILCAEGKLFKDDQWGGSCYPAGEVTCDPDLTCTPMAGGDRRLFEEEQENQLRGAVGH